MNLIFLNMTINDFLIHIVPLMYKKLQIPSKITTYNKIKKSASTEHNPK